MLHGAVKTEEIFLNTFLQIRGDLCSVDFFQKIVDFENDWFFGFLSVWCRSGHSVIDYMSERLNNKALSLNFVSVWVIMTGDEYTKTCGDHYGR